ncbi:MAG: HD domain-containing protein [Gemmatimonadaceae bacterium]|nr:HD domain-containing protein [Gemmatimonadaceae bacterium]
MTPQQLSISEVLAALSYALDLTEGQPAGHTIRACLVGMRLGSEVGLSVEECTALYYALLLKDAGCSSNAARMASLFGADDRVVKPRMKGVDWHRRIRLALRTATTAGLGGSIADRARHFMRIARSGEVTRELIQIRCDRGAGIARRLGFPENTCSAIGSLDEHWCGLGYPHGKAGEDIPRLARIINIAQTVEAFQYDKGVAAAMRVTRARRGTWFDPALADLVLGWRKDREWWRLLNSPDAQQAVLDAEPAGEPRVIDDEELDEIARAFADIIDAKSPYTFEHSTRVAAYAERMATVLQYGEVDLRRMRRAGLLHDIGKLGVSNRILDKPGKLDLPEMQEVELHPRHTYDILSRVPAFASFARMAALHHEKLDGTGYPWGVTAERLDRDARILAVADIYDALTSARPYREALSRDVALQIIESERGTKLCGEAVGALVTATEAGSE